MYGLKVIIIGAGIGVAAVVLPIAAPGAWDQLSAVAGEAALVGGVQAVLVPVALPRPRHLPRAVFALWKASMILDRDSIALGSAAPY